MSVYRGIVLDLDKTVVANGSDEVDPCVIDRITTLQDRGLHIIPATGRAYSFAVDILSVLDVPHAIVDNGARIISNEHESAWSAMLEGEDLYRLALIAESSGAQLYVPNDNKDMRDKESFVDGAYGAWILGIGEQPAQLVLANIDRIDGIDAYPSESWRGPSLVDINIGSSAANKQRAILELLASMGIKPEEMIGIGDGVNDIGFVSCLGFGIAMADGHPELVSQAHTTVPPQSQGGFLNALSIFDCPLISV